MSKVIVIGGLAESLVNFRGELIKSLVKSGNTVIAMAGSTSPDTVRAIQDLGAVFVEYPITRSGMNPKDDLVTLRFLYRFFKSENPDKILAYTIKPVIWGGIAARQLGISHRFYALITGLGFTFQASSFKQKILMSLVKWLYKMAIKLPVTVIFQNQDNLNTLHSLGLVQPDYCFVVDGSGVDLTHFSVSPFPKKKPFVFLTIARLLGAKGLREYAESAKQVLSIYPDTIFRLLGPEDPSPDHIPIEEVRSWHHIEYCGHAQDVRPWIAGCHAYVLNSYHEGMPRTVLEAMAMGRPIITTHVPGCKETVVEGCNGFLVPKCDVASLTEAMVTMIKQADQLDLMGQESRRIVEERFDVHLINSHLFKIMGF
jgi:glycosyltransferase involved in cell wall biosynthesis